MASFFLLPESKQVNPTACEDCSFISGKERMQDPFLFSLHLSCRQVPTAVGYREHKDALAWQSLESTKLLGNAIEETLPW